MDDPRYGTEPPENLPVLELPGVKARVLAGSVGNCTGPFKTVQNVQIVDLSLENNSTFQHLISSEFDTCVLYVFKGEGTIGSTPVAPGNVLKLDATQADARAINFKSNPVSDLCVMIFAGKRLNEPISWGGPIVMNTQQEINTAFQEYRQGTFLRKRAAWDYKKIATKI